MDSNAAGISLPDLNKNFYQNIKTSELKYLFNSQEIDINFNQQSVNESINSVLNKNNQYGYDSTSTITTTSSALSEKLIEAKNLLVPSVSKTVYDKEYDEFILWLKKNNIKVNQLNGDHVLIWLEEKKKTLLCIIKK